MKSLLLALALLPAPAFAIERTVAVSTATGISAATANTDYLNTTGDTATGQVNLPTATISNLNVTYGLTMATGTATSTFTVLGNAFSVGTSSFVVVGSSVGIRTSNPFAALAISSGYIHIDGPSALGVHIGTYPPTANAQLSIQRAGSASIMLKAEAGNPSNSVQLYGPGGGVPLFVMDRADGSIASPILIEPNAVVGEIWWRANDGGTQRPVLKLRGAIEAGSSATSLPSQFRFLTTPYNAVAAQQRMVITSSGSVGINTTTPTDLLDVNGSAIFRGSVTLVGDSSMTIQGSEFSVGASTFVIIGSSVGIRTATPKGALDVASGEVHLGTNTVFLGNTTTIKTNSGATGRILGATSANAQSPFYGLSTDDQVGFGYFNGFPYVTGGGGVQTINFTSNRVRFGPTGGVNLSIVSGNGNQGSIADPVIQREDNPNSGFHVEATDLVHLIANGTSKLSATADAVTTSSSHTVQGVMFSSGANAGLLIASGTAITNIMKSSFTFDFPAAAALGTTSYGFSTTGNSGGGAVARGDICWVEAEALEANLTVSFASATTSGNVLSIRFDNDTAAPIDPALQLFRYGCMRSAN